MSENTEHLVGAVKFLDDAKNEMIDRAKTYDSPGGEKSMGKAIIALNAIAGEDIARTGMRECHGWLLMSIVKSVRQYSRAKPHMDSAVDKVAYSALEAEARMDEMKEEDEKPRNALEAIRQEAFAACQGASWTPEQVAQIEESMTPTGMGGVKKAEFLYTPVDVDALRVPKPEDVLLQEEIVAKAIERWEAAPQDWAFAFTSPMGPDDLEMDGVKVFTLPVAGVTTALNSLIHRNSRDWERYLRAMGIKACKKDEMRKFFDVKFVPSITV